MSALITLDLRSEIAEDVPAQMLAEIKKALTMVSRLNCRELNPRLPKEFEVLRVKAGWRGERWMPRTVHMHGPILGQFTWYPEFFWLTAGIPEVVEQTARFAFSGIQVFDKFENGDPRLLPILQLSHTYIWWTEYFDDVLGDDGERKSFEHRDLHHYSGRGGWVNGVTFGEMLLKLAQARIEEMPQLLLESYQEVEKKLDFTSFALEEAIDALKAPVAA